MASTLEIVLLAALQNLLNTSEQVISETVLVGTQASITVTIPSGYTSVEVRWVARSDTASTETNALLRMNGDTGNNYLWEQLETNNTTTTASVSGALTSSIHIGTMAAASATANYAATGSFRINGIQGSFFKSALGHAASHVNTTQVYQGQYAGQWLNTGPVTSITFFPLAGNLVAGTTVTVLVIK